MIDVRGEQDQKNWKLPKNFLKIECIINMYFGTYKGNNFIIDMEELAKLNSFAIENF